MSGAGMTMATPAGNRGVVCATDARAGQIEDMQITTGLGPCVDAMESGAPVLVGDLDNAADSSGLDLSRWAAFVEGVRPAGVRAVFAFPLRIGSITVGALDLYRDEPGDLTGAQVTAALLAADAAALALLHLNTDSDDAFAPDLETGADYSLHIHQATGMVSVQLGVPVAEALLRLRARAFANGQTLSEIAAEVVARRIRFTAEDR